MPIYEYECKSCGHKLEILQKITEEELKKCPHCGNDALSKLISSTSFQLKGTGWYATDFKDKGKAKPDDAEAKPAEPKSSESKGTDTKETKGTESKSEPKTKTSTTSDTTE